MNSGLVGLSPNMRTATPVTGGRPAPSWRQRRTSLTLGKNIQRTWRFW